MQHSWTAKLLSALVFLSSASAQRGLDPIPIEPAIAPDGSKVVFASRGALWVTALNGGAARQLLASVFEERRPIFSPDGRLVAFVSTRTGGGDIYVLELASGAVKRITFTEGPEILDGWSRDGRWIYFSQVSSDIARMADVYRVPSSGGTPVPVVAERYFSEYFSAPSPSGDRIAFSAYGENFDRWSRNGHSYLDASQIWIRHEKRYSRLNPDSTGKELWPMWSPDGAQIYFVSDGGGAENLWVTRPGAAPRQLTTFRDGRVLWPSISYDGKIIVFERDFAIWALNTASGACLPIPIQLPVETTTSKEHLDVSNQIEEFAVTRDGARVAFISRGEIFLSANAPRAVAVRVTGTAAREAHLSWSPDGVSLVYTSLRSGAYQIFLYDADAKTETAITQGNHDDVAPTWSLDGLQIAFLRDLREVCVYDTKTHSIKTVARGSFGPLPTAPRRNFPRLLAWSPDGSLAYISSGISGFKNVWVVPRVGPEAYQATTIATVEMACLSWSPDSQSVVIDATLGSDVGGSQTLLIAKALPDKHWKAEVLPIDVPAYYQHIVVNPGRRVIFFGKAPDGDQVFLYDPQSPRQLRTLTSTPGLKRGLTYVPSRDEVWFLESGRIRAVNIETANEHVFETKADIDADFSEDKKAVFAEVWRYINGQFYDPEFHGVNWRAQKERYQPYLKRAQTPGELQRVLSLMLGDLNSSHLGITIRAKFGPAVPVGRLGIRFDAVSQASVGVLRVAEVVAGGPADHAGIRVGDSLLAIDDLDLGPNVNLNEYLAGKVGAEVNLLIDSGGIRKAIRTTTIGVVRERELLYEAWIAQNRAYVERVSGGQLGYVHLYDMSRRVMNQLALGLDSSVYSRKGVVIDIRNNYGGAMDGHVLDVFSRKLYLKDIFRSGEVWQRQYYDEQAIELPTVLVTNRHTISDGECFVEGYRAESLGLVVGERTAGWVVVTGGASLVDGSSMSLPTGRTVARDGTDLEQHPRPVDIEVIRKPGDGFSGTDSELDTAIGVLLRKTAVSPAQLAK